MMYVVRTRPKVRRAVIENPTNVRSRRTRDALLAAARALLEEGGFAALTMGAVAERAGVTRRAVYLHFPSRSELVAGLFDHLAAAEGLRESLDRVWAAPDAVAALTEWAAHVARYHPRLLAVDRAVEHVRRADDDAARHRATVAAAKLANCRRLADRLAAEGRLVAPWSPETAADMIYALTTSDVVEGLLADRGWSPEQLARGLARVLRRTFANRDHEKDEGESP
jgi:AcrR family transcriptional regulator